MSDMRFIAAAAVALALGSQASAQQIYDFPVNLPASAPDVTFEQECKAFLSPQITYEDTVDAAGCQRTVVDYFIDRGLFPKEAFQASASPNPTLSTAAECAAHLLLNHIQEPRTAAAILDAEFSKACEPATM